MTLTDYLDEHYSDGTAKIYAFEIGHYLERIGGEAAALQTSYGELVGYLSALRKRYDNPATVRRILFAIKSYYRYLVLSGRRDDHPGSRLRLRDVVRDQVQTQDLLAPNELALLLRPRPNRYALLENRNRVIIGLLVHQALLVREIGALKIGDIDLQKATVRVPATSKTEARTLRLDAAQVMTLHAYLQEDRASLLTEESDHLLLTSRGTPERGEGVHYLVETLRPLLLNKRLTPTTIRQSVIAQKLAEGQGLRQVQAFAGHKKISATEAYRENNLEALRQAVLRFHPLKNETE
ncbi:integrase/recombinase XerD [Neolewinella agarilytica]|uniref:Integrase/recombinase XerD n=2 Tax=Neolewinella agarilytica TaxID=478744 RepID=A0A1H9PET3_9BACT|nr:integrase/recombinase XerD [Neolewinella agarilytica]